MNISRRSFLVMISAAVLALVYFLVGRAPAYRNLPPMATGGWVAFGDSLTEGFGASPGSDYPAQLGARLSIPILNRGVSGETSADGLRRLPGIEAINPRVVLLCFGGNDVLQKIPREQMLANIGEIIDRLQARGSFVVLVGIRGASLVGDRNASGFKRLAREKRVLLIPNILDGIIGTPALMADYVHPNDAGYAKIADRIERALRPLLPRLQS